MMRWAVCWSLILSSSGALGQPRPRRDAGVVDDAGPTARQLVEAARGERTAFDEFGDPRGREPARDEERPLARVVQGRCYALLGAAVGASQVRARVMARGVTVVPDAPLANSRGEAVRREFCVRHPSDWYVLRVALEGSSSWHVALVELGVEVRAPEAPAAPAPEAPAAPAAAARPEPIGGDDYVGAQIRSYARARPRLVGLSPVARGRLSTNETWTARYALPAGRCVELVAAGVPSVRDLALEIEDPAGRRVAQDGTHRATEAVRHCPHYAGTHTVRVRMFAGAGAFAAQLLIEP
ncbi:MAG: hypothetical protein R3A48_08485 [Polyangiales bacterium]